MSDRIAITKKWIKNFYLTRNNCGHQITFDSYSAIIEDLYEQLDELEGWKFYNVGGLDWEFNFGSSNVLCYKNDEFVGWFCAITNLEGIRKLKEEFKFLYEVQNG